MSSANVSAEQLRLFIERIEKLEEEKRGIADDIKDVYAEAKANGQYTFGQEDYPPPVVSHQSETRAQVEQELQQAQVQGQMASDQEDYPPAAMAHSGTSDIH